jgi:hypothetical protein
LLISPLPVSIFERMNISKTVFAGFAAIAFADSASAFGSPLSFRLRRQAFSAFRALHDRCTPSGFSYAREASLGYAFIGSFFVSSHEIASG